MSAFRTSFGWKNTQAKQFSPCQVSLFRFFDNSDSEAICDLIERYNHLLSLMKDFELTDSVLCHGEYDVSSREGKNDCKKYADIVPANSILNRPF